MDSANLCEFLARCVVVVKCGCLARNVVERMDSFMEHPSGDPRHIWMNASDMDEQTGPPRVVRQWRSLQGQKRRRRERPFGDHPRRSMSDSVSPLRLVKHCGFTIIFTTHCCLSFAILHTWCLITLCIFSRNKNRAVIAHQSSGPQPNGNTWLEYGLSHHQSPIVCFIIMIILL